jgi:hypothetical protein
LADALDMSNRSVDALAACREAEKRARLTPNEISTALARVCSWRLSPGRDATLPQELQAKIARLHNPELTLSLDYARLLRAKRAGATNTRALAQQLAAVAGKLGYLTWSSRAASLRE